MHREDSKRSRLSPEGLQGERQTAQVKSARERPDRPVIPVTLIGRKAGRSPAGSGLQSSVRSPLPDWHHTGLPYSSAGLRTTRIVRPWAQLPRPQDSPAATGDRCELTGISRRALGRLGRDCRGRDRECGRLEAPEDRGVERTMHPARKKEGTSGALAEWKIKDQGSTLAFQYRETVTPSPSGVTK